MSVDDGRRAVADAVLAVLLVVTLTAGCTPLRTNTGGGILMPSHDRDWQTSLAVLPRAEFQGDLVRIRNIRNFRYVSEEDFMVDYFDRTFDLRELESVNFVVVPFQSAPSLAHTMLSFGFSDGYQLGVSVEARLEKGEKYSPIRGALRQYELMYVVADERDLIPLRTEHRDCEVYVYRSTATAEKARALFRDVMQRVNQIADDPEFYDTLTNNCTTNIVSHINVLTPGRIPADIRVLLPGYSDQLAYELGLLDTSLSFAETKQRAKINDRVRGHSQAADFSQRIRR